MKKLRTVIIVAISLLIALIVYLCATLDYFSVKTIQVKNSKIVELSKIEDYANYSLGENIFRFNKNELETKISKGIYIRSASIKKIYPDAIEVAVEETKDTCCFEIGKGKFFVDPDFNAIKNKDRIDYSNIAKIVGANENLSRINDLKSDEKFYKFLKNLSSHEVLNQLTEINVYDADGITLLTRNEISVFFGDLNDSERKPSNTSKILDEISIKSISTKMLDTKNPKKPLLVKEDTGQSE